MRASARVLHRHSLFGAATGPNRVEHLIRRRSKLSRVVRQFEMDRDGPLVINVNGVWVPRSQWRGRRIGAGDRVIAITLPAGGGGGSNPLAIVLQIALFAVTGPAGLMASAGYGMVARGLVALAGSALISALTAPPRRTSPQAFADMASPSPTYTLNGQGNYARLGQAIPEHFGRVIAFPDLAAKAYSEFAGEEQYLFQLFCLGQGSYDIEEHRIGESPIASFPEVELQVCPPGTPVTLFPTRVETAAEVSGQDLVTATTLGPFVLAPAATASNRVAFDLVCGRGLYYGNDTGGLDARTVQVRLEVQPIDDSGTPTGAWEVLGMASITGATNTPIRRSFSYDVALGRYQARATRLDTKDTSARAGHEVAWFAARSYMPGAQLYGDVTLIAMKARASNALSAQSARQYNVIATRKLKTWSPEDGWSVSEISTKNPAWALAHICRSANGAAMADTQYGLAELHALAIVAAARGDELNLRFDAKMGWFEALRTAARVLRVQPYQQGGVMHFVRDEARTVPTVMFTPRNIVQGSFRIEQLLVERDTPDSVEVEYFDDGKWAWERVLCVPPDSPAVRPALVRFPGVTKRSQAWREGMFMAGEHLYRGERYRFTTELEGHICALGDLIALSHDRVSWGQTGDVLAVDVPTREVTLSEAVTFSSGTHYLQVSRRDGTRAGPFVCTATADPNVVVVATLTGFPLDFDDGREASRFAFGPGSSTIAQDCVVLSVTPRGEHEVEIAVANEDPLVHTIDGGTPPVAVPGWVLPNVPSVPTIPGDLKVVSAGTPASPRLHVSWPAAPGAAEYRVRHSVNGTSWTSIATTQDTSIQFDVPAGLNYVEVTPLGGGPGSPRTWSGTVAGDLVAPSTVPAITGLTATGGLTSILLEWADPAYAQGEWVEVLRNTSNDSSGARVIDRVPYAPARLYYDALGMPATQRWYWIRIVNKLGVAGPLSNTATAVTSAVPPPGPGTIGYTQLLSDLTFSISGPSLIYNGSAEDGTNGWQVNNGTLIADPSQKTQGKHAFRLSAQPFADFVSAVAIPVEPGSRYVLKVKVLGSAATAGGLYVRIQEFTLKPSGLLGADSVQDLVGNGAFSASWVSYELPFVVPDNRLWVAVRIFKFVGGPDDAWFDEIELVKQITSADLRSGSILTTHISDGAVTTPQLAAGAVVADKIGANAIVADKIAANAVVADKISAGAVLADKIAANAVTAEKINAGAVTAGKISVSSLAAISADMGAITAGTITVSSTGFIRGGATDYLTGIGFFIGYHSGAYKLSVGNPSGNHLAWNGSALVINGQLGNTKPYSAGDKIVAAAPTRADALDTFSPGKSKEFVVGRTGTLRVKWRQRGLDDLNGVTVTVRKNGTAVSSALTVYLYQGFIAQSFDMSGIAKDDLVQLYTNGFGFIDTVTLSAAESDDITAPTMV